MITSLLLAHLMGLMFCSLVSVVVCNAASGRDGGLKWVLVSFMPKFSKFAGRPIPFALSFLDSLGSKKAMHVSSYFLLVVLVI